MTTTITEYDQKLTALSVQLAMPASTQAALSEHEGAVELASAYEIDSADMAEAANDQLREFKAAAEKLDELYKGFVEPATQIMRNARALFNPAREALDQGVTILKGKLLEFQRAEQRKVDEARRQREEAERAARQEADRKAAAERARAEEQAREQRRRAEEAEEARRKAEAEGNARAAAAAAAKAAEATQKAEAAIENGEARAQAAQLEAAALPAPAVPAPTKLAGLTTRKNWQAFLADGVTKEQAVVLIAAALQAHPEYAGLLSVDMGAATKLAKALEGRFQVPGLRAENVPIVSSSSRR